MTVRCLLGARCLLDRTALLPCPPPRLCAEIRLPVRGRPRDALPTPRERSGRRRRAVGGSGGRLRLGQLGRRAEPPPGGAPVGHLEGVEHALRVAAVRAVVQGALLAARARARRLRGAAARGSARGLSCGGAAAGLRIPRPDLHLRPVRALRPHQDAPLPRHMGGALARRPPHLLLRVHLPRRGRLHPRLRLGRGGERFETRAPPAHTGLSSPPPWTPPTPLCPPLSRALTPHADACPHPSGRRRTCCTTGSRAPPTTTACASTSTGSAPGTLPSPPCRAPRAKRRPPRGMRGTAAARRSAGGMRAIPSEPRASRERARGERGACHGGPARAEGRVRCETAYRMAGREWLCRCARLSARPLGPWSLWSWGAVACASHHETRPRLIVLIGSRLCALASGQPFRFNRELRAASLGLALGNPVMSH